MRRSRTCESSITLSWSARLASAKVALANVIAQEMATDFHEVLGQSLNSPAEFNALVVECQGP